MKQIKKKRPPETIKEKRWLAKTIEYGNATKAALEVYNCNENSARSIGAQNLAKLSIEDALEAEGLTDHRAAVSIREGLEAMKIHGTSDNFVEIQDKATQHKYLETLLRLRNHGPNNGVTFNVDNRKVYVELPKRESVIKEEGGGALARTE